jgi:protein-tyrosine-phosphatase
VTSAAICAIKQEVSLAAYPRPIKVIFVCVGNACRSQMAEALARHHGNGRVEAWSAGSAPLGHIVAETYDVLEEKGISLEGHTSKSLRDVPLVEMDVVVGMGCEVVCPVPAGFKGRVIQWNIPDPCGRGMDSFRAVRDLIDRQVRSLLDQLFEAGTEDGMTKDDEFVGG